MQSFIILDCNQYGPSVANDIVITDILSSNFDVHVDAITFSHEISTGYADELHGDIHSTIHLAPLLNKVKH